MKSWLKSKTLWFNFLGGVVGVVLTQLQSAPLDPQILAVVLAVGNGILHFLTREPITVSPGS